MCRSDSYRIRPPGLFRLLTLFDGTTPQKGVYCRRNGYSSVAGIVLVPVYLGVKKVILVFGVLMIIAIVAFLKKFNNPPTVHNLRVSDDKNYSRQRSRFSFPNLSAFITDPEA